MVPLEASNLLKDLTAADLEPIRAAVQERAYQAGEPVFREGDPGDGLYLIRSGQIEISALIQGDRSHPFSRLGPGDFFGEMAVLDRQPRSASAIAAVDSQLYFVPCDAILALLTQSPPLCLTLLQEISRRVREFNRLYVRELLMSERMALVGRFASSIVHDLKNPLTIIGIAAEMACLQEATPRERATAQQRIMRQIERITGMVNEILEFTRGTPAAPTLVATDYAAYIRSLADELQSDLARKAVTLDCEQPPACTVLRLNPPRLTRLFHNLILNAVDEMPEGGRITLKFRESGAEVVTEIHDTGKGIAPEIQGTMFEPFATYGKTKGTGLGLSICQRIIEEHGGRIWAANSPHAGAVFSFALPKPRSPGGP